MDDMLAIAGVADVTDGEEVEVESDEAFALAQEPVSEAGVDVASEIEPAVSEPEHEEVRSTSPRGATSLSALLAPGERELRDFVLQSETRAHVLSTLEMVARRVRAGEIVPAIDAGATPEAVLASVLASILSSRT